MTTILPKRIVLDQKIMLDIITKVVEAFPSLREIDIKIAGDEKSTLIPDTGNLMHVGFSDTQTVLPGIDRVSFQIDGKIIRFTLVK